MLLNIIAIGYLVYVYYLASEILKAGDATPLTKSQNLQVIISIYLASPFSWIVYKAVWKDDLPLKTKYVTDLLKNYVKLLVIISLVAILLAIVLVAIRPR